jgi:MFS family permease
MAEDKLPLKNLAVPASKPGFFYGYIIVLCSFLTLFLSFGVYYSFGVFFNPLLTEFGWSRAETSAAYSLCQILSGVLGIVAGRACDSFGPKLIFLGSGILLAVGCFLMSQIREAWQLYLYFGVLIGFAVGGIMVPAVSTVSRWFAKRRGVMTGIVASGIGCGILVFPIVVNWLLNQYSWRTSFVILGAASLIVIVIASQFLKRDPGKIGQLPYGFTGEQVNIKTARKDEGLSFKETLRTGRFWVISVIYIFFGFYVQTIMVHVVPHAKTLGFDAGSAAVVLSIVGGGSLVGRVTMGGVSDRIGVKASMIISLSLITLGFIWLQAADALWKLYLFAPIYGFAYGAMIALQALIGARFFGLAALGTIMGTIVFMYTAGGAIGPIVSGYIFDVTGSYRLAFIVCAALALGALVLAISLRQAHKTGKG